MAPTRRVTRATASPSPAPHARAATPRAGTPARGNPIKQIPAKFSTSYGSPMTALPDRANVVGGNDLGKAAAEMFTSVKRDNVVAEARHRAKSPMPAAQPTSDDEAPEPELSGPSEDRSEYEYEDDPDDPENPRLRRKPARKRARDEEADGRAEEERERKERAARLQRERSAEARRRANEKRAAAKAADAERERLHQQAQEEAAAAEREGIRQYALQKQAADRERLRQQALREEAARAAMPPPKSSAPRPPAAMTPTSTLQATDFSSPRPGSARSFIEERNLFLDAQLQTPKPPTRIMRQARPAPPAPPPAVAPPNPPSPPTVSPRVSRRPNGKTPGPQIDVSPPPERTTLSQHLGLGSRSSQGSMGEAPPRYTSRTSDPVDQPESSPKPPNQAAEERNAEPARAAVPDSKRKVYFISKDNHGLMWILRSILSAFILLHLLRLSHILLRPDQFESPQLRLNWYGWRSVQNWTSNAVQFFPSPLLHPLGVLTNNQYDDLKDYLQRRTTTTEAAVENLKLIIPRVVSVRKDMRGRVSVAPDFWDALRTRIMDDGRFLTLNGRNRDDISDMHWKALQERLKKAGVFDKKLSTADVERIVEQARLKHASKSLSADDVERIVEHARLKHTEKPLTANDVQQLIEKLAPTAWEKWLQKNQQKVADIIEQTKGKAPVPSRGAGSETLVSRDEFIRELNNNLAKNKKEIDAEMESLRKELHTLVKDVKAKASSDGLSASEVQTLIKKIISKEVGDRQLIIGYKGGVREIDAALKRRVNHFSLGNNALAEGSLTSPPWKISQAPNIGSKQWPAFMRTVPRFHRDANQALTSWSEPGHCYCAGRGRAGTPSSAAIVAVEIAKAVIPQHIVLEHIDPEATNDPGAMPQDVEVWISVDDAARRDRLRNWMGATFPPGRAADPGSDKLLRDGFVKVGAFAYTHVPKDEGVYVHKLSSELVSLAAATDLVLVRAVTNYGASDHTCFYRIRMYGEVMDLEGEAGIKRAREAGQRALKMEAEMESK